MKYYKNVALLLAATATTMVAYQEVSADTLIEESEYAVNPYAPTAILQPAEEVRVVANADLPIVNNLSDLKQVILDGMKSFSTTVQVQYQGDTSNMKQDFMGAIEEAVEMDDYALGTVSQYGYSAKGYKNDMTVTISLAYYTIATQEQFVQSEVKRLVKALIRPQMTDVEKVYVINDWIAKKTTYTENTKSSPHAAYAILAEGKGVCQAYALLAYLMLKEAGVEARYVTGYAGESHAWNLVKVDGLWYHLDVTWNDPVWDASHADLANFVRYDYFLISDKEIEKDHQIDARAGLPNATSERFKALRSTESTLFTYSGIPYLLMPEYVDGKLYYVNDNSDYAIDRIDLLAPLPVVERFANIRAMDILATDQYLYFVNVNTGMDVSKIDLITKEVVDFKTGYKITSLKKDENYVYGYNNSKLVFEEAIEKSLDIPEEPVYTVPTAVINAISALDERKPTFIQDVGKLQRQFDALSEGEQALVWNEGQLQAAQKTVAVYETEIKEIEQAIDALDAHAGNFKAAVQAVRVEIDQAAPAVIAGITNLEEFFALEKQSELASEMMNSYPSAETTDPMKTWTVKLSLAVDAQSITKDNLYIVDGNQQKIALKSVEIVDNTIRITPAVAYSYDEIYTLYMHSSILSVSGKELPATKFQFKIKKPIVQEERAIVNLTENLSAIVVDANDKTFALDLMVNGQQVGGYETAVGKTVGGRTIGQSTHTEKEAKEVIDGKQYYFLYDTTTTKLRAVYWENVSASTYFNEWSRPTTQLANKTIAELNLMLTNEFRVKNNASKLLLHEQITDAAYNHSRDMAQKNYFSHTNLNGQSSADRIKLVCSSCSYIGENIAAGYRNIFIAHNGWINSSGHRENMLNVDYTHMGTGVYYVSTSSYGVYYTTNFGRAK